MSIQYAGGTIVNTILTQSTGTRLELANWVSNSLITAGWSQSGSSGDYFNVSATTPQGFSIRIECKDPGSGNCAQFKMSLPDTTRAQIGAMFLLPATGKIWRIIANKYQFFVFALGAPQGRDFICGGVPYSPLATLPSNLAFVHSNSINDTDVSIRYCFRNTLTTDYGSPGVGNAYHLYNGNEWEINNTTTYTTAGCQRLFEFNGAGSATATVQFRWADGSLLAYEPLIAWGLTANTDEGMIRGQIWDSVIISDQFIGDTNITFDTHTYYAVTHLNLQGGIQRGTLFVAVT